MPARAFETYTSFIRSPDKSPKHQPLQLDSSHLPFPLPFEDVRTPVAPTQNSIWLTFLTSLSSCHSNLRLFQERKFTPFSGYKYADTLSITNFCSMKTTTADNMKVISILILARRFVHSAINNEEDKAWQSIVSLINERDNFADFLYGRRYDAIRAKETYEMLQSNKNAEIVHLLTAGMDDEVVKEKMQQYGLPPA